MFSIIETNKVLGLAFWLWLSICLNLRDYINCYANQLFQNDSLHITDNENKNVHRKIFFCLKKRFLFPFRTMQ